MMSRKIQDALNRQQTAHLLLIALDVITRVGATDRSSDGSPDHQ